MKFSARFSLWGSAIFAVFCLGYAFSGFSSLDAMADDATRVDARGFAFFWLFLAAVAIVIGIASWWMMKHSDD